MLTIAMPFRSAGKGTYYSGANPWSNRTWGMYALAVPFNWHDKHYEYEDAFEHLLSNLRRAVRFQKLVLVLPEWYDVAGFHICDGDFCYTNHHLQNGNGERLEASDIWRLLTDFVEDKARDGVFKIEVVRLCDEKKVCDDEWQSGKEAWEAYRPNLWKSHDVLIRKLRGLAGEKVVVEVKGAFVVEDGAWKVIEDLPESSLLPVGEEEDGDSKED